MSTKPSTGRVRSAYQFIKAHRDQYSVQMMCRVLGVAPSGYCDWLLQPISNRAQEDARLLRLIRDVADYIDTFYNRTRHHSHVGGVSPEQFEAAHKRRRKGLH